MKSTFRIKATLANARLLAVLLCFILPYNLQSASEIKLPPMPAAVSNNAVASSHAGEVGQKIFSFMGIGPKKTWDAVTTSAFELDLKTGKWKERRPVPGVAGRLAASAVALNEQVFLFGGYVVDRDGIETTLSDLNVYVPVEDRYYRGKDIPVPVEDAVVGLFRDRFIYLIGGWSKGDAVRNVQIYDTEKDQWMQATPLPGTPVFGHAGAIVGDTIVYVDGAYRNSDPKGPKYVASSECWMGKIPTSKKADITKIEWTKLPAHPGNARFRIAAGAGARRKRAARFISPAEPTILMTTTGLGTTGRLANRPR